MTNWQFTESTLGVLMQPCVREKREIPSKTGALALRDKRKHELITAIIYQSRVENGNHQKLVSASLSACDDPLHLLDLALAVRDPTPFEAAWRGVWEQSCLGAGAAGGATWLSSPRCP